MRLFKSIILFFLLISSSTMLAQKDFFKNTYVSPEISVGYTFNARIHIGFGLDLAWYNSENPQMRYGFSFSYNLIRVRDRFHRQSALSLMHQTAYSDIKIGIGRMRNGWGFENRNACIVWGLASDVSFNLDHKFSPKIGYRNFFYPKRKWAWFEHYYHSLYLGYEYYD